VAQQHHGGSDEVNLALACHFCNRHKGPNLTGIDPTTGELTRLFNPVPIPGASTSRSKPGASLVSRPWAGQPSMC
jgi:hypothetical protein